MQCKFNQLSIPPVWLIIMKRLLGKLIQHIPLLN